MGKVMKKNHEFTCWVHESCLRGFKKSGNHGQSVLGSHRFRETEHDLGYEPDNWFEVEVSMQVVRRYNEEKWKYFTHKNSEYRVREVPDAKLGYYRWCIETRESPKHRWFPINVHHHDIRFLHSILHALEGAEA